MPARHGVAVRSAPGPALGPATSVTARTAARFAVLCLAVLGLAVPASAHVPEFDAPGATRDTAVVIGDPQKSWVYYGDVGPGQAWYRFDAEAGDELYVSAQVPAGQTALPRVHLIGPGLPEGAAPEGAPDGLGVRALEATGDVSLEPFSPLAMKGAGELRMPAPADGTYYVVVAADAPLRYSMAVGLRESFTPWEWTTIPWERIAIQQWGGVPEAWALAGEILAVIAAGALLFRAGERDARRWTGALGAALVGGSALTVLVLTLIALAAAGWTWGALIPFAFAAAAAGVGWAAWRTVRRGGARWAGALYAVLGVVAWAGLIVGPVLLLAWSAWPRPAGRAASSRGPGPEDVPVARDV